MERADAEERLNVDEVDDDDDSDDGDEGVTVRYGKIL